MQSRTRGWQHWPGDGTESRPPVTICKRVQECTCPPCSAWLTNSMRDYCECSLRFAVEWIQIKLSVGCFQSNVPGNPQPCNRTRRAAHVSKHVFSTVRLNSWQVTGMVSLQRIAKSLGMRSHAILNTRSSTSSLPHVVWSDCHPTSHLQANAFSLRSQRPWPEHNIPLAMQGCFGSAPVLAETNLGGLDLNALWMFVPRHIKLQAPLAQSVSTRSHANRNGTTVNLRGDIVLKRTTL